jgi:hypothetical protein
MGARYNAIAGQSVGRLASLSDGLFAVVMTLLVLDLKLPAAQAITPDGALLAALRELAPRIVAGDSVWDDFFASPGIDIGEHEQPSA